MGSRRRPRQRVRCRGEASAVRARLGCHRDALRTFNSNATCCRQARPNYRSYFSPVGTVERIPFQSGPMCLVKADASTLQTVAIVLIDPDGNRYGSSIGIPAPVAGMTARSPPGRRQAGYVVRDPSAASDLCRALRWNR